MRVVLLGLANRAMSEAQAILGRVPGIRLEADLCPPRLAGFVHLPRAIDPAGRGYSGLDAIHGLARSLTSAPLCLCGESEAEG